MHKYSTYQKPVNLFNDGTVQKYERDYSNLYKVLAFIVYSVAVGVISRNAVLLSRGL